MCSSSLAAFYISFIQIIASVVSIVQITVSKSKKLYWEDSYLEELPFDGDIERWLVVAFDAVSILGALFCMISNLKNIVPAMIISIVINAVAFVGEVALFALFAVSYFKADDYPTDITAVLVLVFMPLIFIVAILAIVVTIISFRRARNMYQKDDDGHSCELTTATRV